MVSGPNDEHPSLAELINQGVQQQQQQEMMAHGFNMGMPMEIPQCSTSGYGSYQTPGEQQQASTNMMPDGHGYGSYQAPGEEHMQHMNMMQPDGYGTYGQDPNHINHMPMDPNFTPHMGPQEFPPQEFPHGDFVPEFVPQLQPGILGDPQFDSGEQMQGDCMVFQMQGDELVQQEMVPQDLPEGVIYTHNHYIAPAEQEVLADPELMRTAKDMAKMAAEECSEVLKFYRNEAKGPELHISPKHKVHPCEPAFKNEQETMILNYVQQTPPAALYPPGPGPPAMATLPMLPDPAATDEMLAELVDKDVGENDKVAQPNPNSAMLPGNFKMAKMAPSHAFPKPKAAQEGEVGELLTNQMMTGRWTKGQTSGVQNPADAVKNMIAANMAKALEQRKTKVAEAVPPGTIPPPPPQKRRSPSYTTDDSSDSDSSDSDEEKGPSIEREPPLPVPAAATEDDRVKYKKIAKIIYGKQLTKGYVIQESFKFENWLVKRIIGLNKKNLKNLQDAGKCAVRAIGPAEYAKKYALQLQDGQTPGIVVVAGKPWAVCHMKELLETQCKMLRARRNMKGKTIIPIESGKTILDIYQICETEFIPEAAMVDPDPMKMDFTNKARPGCPPPPPPVGEITAPIPGAVIPATKKRKKNDAPNMVTPPRGLEYLPALPPPTLLPGFAPGVSALPVPIPPPAQLGMMLPPPVMVPTSSSVGWDGKDVGFGELIAPDTTFSKDDKRAEKELKAKMKKKQKLKEEKKKAKAEKKKTLFLDASGVSAEILADLERLDPSTDVKDQEAAAKAKEAEKLAKIEAKKREKAKKLKALKKAERKAEKQRLQAMGA